MRRNPIIKVCGLNTVSNLKEIASLDIHMVGLNFYAPSSRSVDLDNEEFKKACSILQKDKVGVFVNASLDFVLNCIGQYGLSYVQLHGGESPEYCNVIMENSKVIKVFRVSDNFDFDSIQPYDTCNLFLFDTYTSAFGGSGHTFDWELLSNYEGKTPFLLAGGISPNDSDKIYTFSHTAFLGVDINSKFEVSPGIKDVSKVMTFVTELHQYSTNI